VFGDIKQSGFDMLVLGVKRKGIFNLLQMQGWI